MNETKLFALQVVTGRTLGGWEHTESVTTPRPSCLPIWSIRNDLRNLAPGMADKINGCHVYRLNSRKRKPLYKVGDDDTLRTFAATLELLEGRAA